MISILFVDDDPSLLDVGKIFLEENEGYCVDCALSGDAAFGMIAERKYNAVVSDYQMPGMDGITLLKKVRTTHKTLPFILFTGKGREEVAIEALNEGADFYLQKGGASPGAVCRTLTQDPYGSGAALCRGSIQRE